MHGLFSRVKMKCLRYGHRRVRNPFAGIFAREKLRTTTALARSSFMALFPGLFQQLSDLTGMNLAGIGNVTQHHMGRCLDAGFVKFLQSDRLICHCLNLIRNGSYASSLSSVNLASKPLNRLIWQELVVFTEFSRRAINRDWIQGYHGTGK